MKNVVLGLLLASSSTIALASDNSSTNTWVGGVSYANLSDKEDGTKISLGAVIGSLGYKIESGDDFYLMPEVRIGVGITDDTVSDFGIDVGVELDRFLALSVRGQYEIDNDFFLFVAPTYANAKLTASASQGGQSISDSEDSWEFGLGLGAGYSFNSSTSAEISYEQFDGTDVFSLAIKFNF